LVPATNLIFQHGIANVLDYTSQFVGILDVVEKTLKLPLFFQWLEFSENLSKFPNDLCPSDSDLDLEEFGHTVPTSFSFLAP